ncbi:Foldase protein PrsA precursor [hydrothermal vent metagenome]|uniref:Foldase protein PrsA n=1 Tax=hydrothermal vent metagenome TaxID=652676 RepID=A0A3B1CKE1_9ZZZZ
MSFSNVAKGEIVDRIVANVNGEIILFSELRRQIMIFQSMKARGARNITDASLAPREVLQTMIDEKILANYAKEKEIIVKEKDIDKRVEQVKSRNGFTDKVLAKMLEDDGMTLEQYRKRIRDQIMIQRVTNFDMPPITISDEEVERYYRLNKDKFKSEVKVRASHLILLVTSDSGPEDVKKAEKEIFRLYQEIKDGADFAEMAKMYSQDGAAKIGGDLGWFGKGSMLPEFERVAFGMKEGELSKPLRTKFGFHLIKLTGREDESMLSIEDAKKEIRNMLQKNTFDKKRKAWLERLRDQAYVRIIY